MKILIFGASGAIGHVLMRQLSAQTQFKCQGTVRSLESVKNKFEKTVFENLLEFEFENNIKSLETVLKKSSPEIIINAIGIIKQIPKASQALETIQLNALFPHQLREVCSRLGMRLIQLSTDCVFDGLKGNYSEKDSTNATDLYGKTKALGEISEAENCLTLRTSTIGHELSSKNGLLEWFLSQENSVKGFRKAIYSGVTTLELSKAIAQVILLNRNLKGLVQIASKPISKYELLRLIAKIYKKPIEIIPFDDFHCDRSLDGSPFRSLTGYIAPSWEEMIVQMHADYLSNPNYAK